MSHRTFLADYYDKGFFDPANPATVRHQLMSDSHSMIEAWPFEHLLARFFLTGRVRLGPLYKDFHYSTDWVCTHGAPHLYKVIASPGQPERLDGVLLDALKSALGVPVSLVTEIGGRLHEKECTTGEWEEMQRQEHPYMPSPPDAARQLKALDHFLLQLSPVELRRLSIKRLLMNCFLRYPVDIDGILMSGEGVRLAVVEFKRKYPDQQGCYGLDKGSALRTYQMCRSRSIDFIHIVLNDPVTPGQRVGSPIELFHMQDTRALEWRCSRLTRHADLNFRDGRTPAAVAGAQTHAIREQGMFPAEMMTPAAVGLQPAELDLVAETS